MPFSHMADFREVCQTEKYLVSVAFLRTVGKGSSFHSPVLLLILGKKRGLKLHLANVLEISNCLVPKDEVWIFSYPIRRLGYYTDSAHIRAFHTIKVTLLLLLSTLTGLFEAFRQFLLFCAWWYELLMHLT